MVSTAHLKKGHTRSCGCLQREQTAARNRDSSYDLTGEKFGWLTVVEKTDERIGSNVVWLCICECGNTKRVVTSKLIEGSTKSCGCLRSHNLVGEVFGRLTVIGKMDERRDGEIVWLCVCECGQTTKVRTGGLMSGNTQGCGCRMGNPLPIVVGFKVNRLILMQICETRSERGERLGLWDCECGTESYLCSIRAVLNERVKSCGCLRREKTAAIQANRLAKWEEHGASFIDELRSRLEGSESLDLEASKGAVLPADPGGSDVPRPDGQAVE
jgi:hypothetical protein